MDNIGAPPVFKSTNFVLPLLVSLSGVVCASMAVFLYHFFLVKYWRERRRRRRRARAALEILGDDHRHVVVAGGLNLELLESVPVVPYSLARIQGRMVMDQRECVVCIGELEEGDMVRLLPACRHAFHMSCIDRWFAAHSSCPVCRARVEDPETAAGGSRMQNGVVALESDDINNDHQAAAAAAAAGVVADSSSSSSSSSAAIEMHLCGGLIRHCASLVMLPAERRSSPRRLKRSLSMDLSFVIDMPPPSVTEVEEEDDEQRRRHCCSPFVTDPLTESVTRSGSIYIL